MKQRARVARVEFSVYGTPKAAPRPRAGRYGVYHDPSADHWKELVTLGYLGSRDLLTEGPVVVRLEFIFERSKKTSKAVQYVEIFHTKKPDIDNLEKSVLDALTKAGAWKDDAYVASIHSVKRYARFGEKPGVHIALEIMPFVPSGGVRASSLPGGAEGIS
jgi:Holliday junction resolvase RusA-like endonuclease